MFCAMDYGSDFESFMFGSRGRRRRRNMKWKIF
jgi:hypothetical protein